MIKKYDIFQNINEDYSDLKSKYHSLGEYVEHLSNIIDDEERFSQILGEYLKVPTKKYNIKTFKVDDYVSIEYWYNDIITPVKIINKKGRTYDITHNIEESEIQNAPDEQIQKDKIVDHYRKTDENKKEKNIDTSIRISNAVNVLNSYDQMLLVKKLRDEFKIEENNHFDLEEAKDLTLLGKTGFNSFIKVLSALNLPNVEIDKENCPKDFFVIFLTEKLNKERLLKIFKRFKSMAQISEIISKSDDQIRIYFGMKYNSKLFVEYGIVKGEKRTVIGEFGLSKSNWNKLKEKNSKPLKSLQSQIANIEIKDLKRLMKIKGDISNFSPGYFHEKSNPYIVAEKDKDDNVVNLLVQGYYGTGKWEQGTITSNSYNEIKSSLKEWILTQKWAKDVVFNLKPDKFWLWIKIKLND